MNISRGPMTSSTSSRGNATYQVELAHPGLHRHRVIKGPDPNFVERKVTLQIQEWDEQWQRRASAAHRHATAQQNQALAEHRTAEANDILDSLRSALPSSLNHEHAVNWQVLKSSTPFPEAAPLRPNPPPPAVRAGIPREPARSDIAYESVLTLVDKLLPS